MSKPTQVALFTLAALLASGCQPELAELDCASFEDCGIEFQMDPGFAPESTAEAQLWVAPFTERGNVRVEIEHDALCAPPELVVRPVGHGGHGVVLAALDVYSVDRCPNSGQPVISEISIELPDIARPGVCVGTMALAVPTSGGRTRIEQITLGQPVCEGRRAFYSPLELGY